MEEAILQAIALHLHYLVRAEQIPQLVQILLSHFPEQIRIAHSRENVERLKKMEPRARVELELVDIYGNIADAVTDENHKAIDYIYDAMKELGITPKTIAMRGGTDGSYISTQKIMTPNYFSGGMNFHSRFEFLPVSSFVKSYEMTMKLLELIVKNA